jgi:DNA modification methylase
MSEGKYNLDKIINRVFTSDCLKFMRRLPDRCIDFCMTSPPYWSLRDYGIKEQIGLENTPEEYIEKLVIVFRELKRILKDTGSLYLNLGDTYIGSACGYRQKGEVKNTIAKTPPRYISNKQKPPSLISVDKSTWKKPKQLALIPSRVAIALQSDGLILRNDICWYKPNAMPSSVKDRLTNHWEHIFHFVKQRKYYYDLDPVREPHKSAYRPFNYRVRLAQQGRTKDYMVMASKYETEVAYRMGIRKNKQYQGKGSLQNTIKSFNLKGKNPGDVLNWREEAKKRGQLFNKPINNQGGGNTGLKKFRGYKIKAGSPYDYSCKSVEQHRGVNVVYSQKGKNPGDFWKINTKPFPGAHFAVYPEGICVKPIKSSCPPDGIVFDMFDGAGTTLVVAKKLGRKFIGCDINRDYVKLARKRLRTTVESSLC